jgi:hypothetical protein
MKLVKMESGEGWVWVNPDMIQYIREDTAKRTSVVFLGGQVLYFSTKAEDVNADLERGA